MTDIYERLRERLDKFPQGFPKTESGVELEILERLYNPEEAEIMFALRPYPESVSTIAERMKKDEAELGDILYTMSKKGLILRFKASETEIYYFMAPWMVGIWEFQVNNLTPETITLYEKYFEEGVIPANKKKNTAGFRAIPIETEIKGNSEVQPYEKISEIIEANSKFAVAECICRKEARMLDQGCDKLLESCLSFGVAADFYIENGLAREITKQEALQVLNKAEEDGLVHFSSNHMGDKMFICNCCSCCCKALANITKHDNFGVIAQSNYYAVSDKETCTGCETCLDRCQVFSIHMEDEHAVIDRNKCIGCGLCVSTCATESISMIHKEPGAASPIFADGNELMQAAAKDTNKIYPFE